MTLAFQSQKDPHCELLYFIYPSVFSRQEYVGFMFVC